MAKKPTPAPTPVAGAAPPPPVPATAQAAPVTPSVAPAPPVPQLPFKIEVGVALPERTRVGNTTGEPSPYVAFMKSMPAEVTDATGQVTRASFFIPAKEAPATITDATERDKFAKDEARKVTNNVGAISRRIKKADATYNFTTREVTEGGKRGVRVWRVAPVEAAPATT